MHAVTEDNEEASEDSLGDSSEALSVRILLDISLQNLTSPYNVRQLHPSVNHHQLSFLSVIHQNQNVTPLSLPALSNN